MRKRSWTAVVLMLNAICARAADPRPAGGSSVPPKPHDPRMAAGMPNQLAPSMTIYNQRASPTVLSKSAKSAEANDDPLTKMVPEKYPLPDGYVRVQASADWRGKSMTWYRGQARAIVNKVGNEQPRMRVKGVAIIDSVTGDILQLISAVEIADVSIDESIPTN